MSGERLISLSGNENGWRQLTLFWRDERGEWQRKCLRLTTSEWARVMRDLQGPTPG